MQRPTMDLSQYVGARVVRGEHWRWGEQDGGEGHMGVVRAFEPPAQVVIVWDNGTAANYRCGPIATDLRVLDSAPSGNFKHEGITCSACKTQPIFGDRWQCAQCEGVNLCSTCYHGGRHSVRHSFYRLAHLNATVTHSNDTTPPRRGARTVTCKGLAPGAKVKRGPDWDWGDQDGGLGCVGKIVRLHAWMEGRVRSAAYVRWSSTGNENLYRLGVDGLMDLKCIAPAKGYTYYVDHLSPLGGSSPGNAMGSPLLPPSPQNHSNSPHFLDHLYPSANESGIVPISLGDAVVVAVDVATLQHMQAGHGEWNDQMCECICSSGTVIDFDADGDAVVFYAASGNRWTLNTAALCRANGQTAGVNGDPLTLGVGGDSPALGGAGEREGGTQFSVGDHVRLAASAARVRALQHGHGGWAEGMLSAVGRRGTVSSVFADGDIAVRMADGRTWTLNPTCVAPAAAMQHAVLTPQSSAGPADAIVSQQLNSAMGEGVTSENSTGHMATLLRRLFDEQTSPSTPSSVQEELIKAAALGDCDTCSKLLGCKDVHVDSITEVDVDALCAGHTALQAAAQHGHLDVVRMLVKLAGAGVSVADADGDTPVHHAAYGDEPAAVQLLHSLGADINARNGRGQTPLHIAVNVGAAAVVRTLLKLNAIADLQDTDGDTPLHDAVARRREDVVKALAQAGAQLALANNKGFSPLHTAALRANAGATRVLISQILRRGEPWLVDQCKEDGYTPLHVAALNGHVQVAELLVGKGKADVDRLNHSNQTPLHLAVHKQHFSIVRLLVRNGRAQVNPKDKDGDTPLHEALRRHTMDQLELLTDVAAVGRLLIGARADADSHLSDNVPPSPETKSDQRQEEQQQPQSTIVGDQPISVNLATFLVSNGADLTVKNKKGQTPLDLCADAKMCKLLVQCQKDRLTRRMNTSKQVFQ